MYTCSPICSLLLEFFYSSFQVDVTELVVGHTSYLSLVQQVLDQLELNTYYPVFYPSTPRSR